MIILYFVYNLNEIYENYNFKHKLLGHIYIFMFIFFLINYLIYIYFTKVHMPYLENKYNLYKLYEPESYKLSKKNILYI